jgi:hypothetical protein
MEKGTTKMKQKEIKYTIYLRDASVEKALRDAKLLYPWENLVNIQHTERGNVIVTAERNN